MIFSRKKSYCITSEVYSSPEVRKSVLLSDR